MSFKYVPPSWEKWRQIPNLPGVLEMPNLPILVWRRGVSATLNGSSSDCISPLEEFATGIYSRSIGRITVWVCYGQDFAWFVTCPTGYSTAPSGWVTGSGLRRVCYLSKWVQYRLSVLQGRDFSECVTCQTGLGTVWACYRDRTSPDVLPIQLKSVPSGHVTGTERRRVCYLSNWVQYRPGGGKFLPTNVNASLCTHILYACM